MAPRSHNPSAERSHNPAGLNGQITTQRPGRGSRRIPLDAVVGSFFADCRARGLSPRTLEAYAAAITSFRDALGIATARQALADLELDAARRWVAAHAEGRGPATVRGRVRALKVLSRWCVREGYLRDDPLSRLALPRVPRIQITPFTDEQISQLLSAATPEIRIVLELMLDTGLRSPRRSMSGSLTLRAASSRSGARAATSDVSPTGGASKPISAGT